MNYEENMAQEKASGMMKKKGKAVITETRGGAAVNLFTGEQYDTVDQYPFIFFIFQGLRRDEKNVWILHS